MSDLDLSVTYECVGVLVEQELPQVKWLPPTYNQLSRGKRLKKLKNIHNNDIITRKTHTVYQLTIHRQNLQRS